MLRIISRMTVPSETVSRREELMQIDVVRGSRDFRTKDFVALKNKGLVLATLDEFKELTGLTTILGRRN